MPCKHPVTGEDVAEDPASLRLAINDTDEEIGRHYRAIADLREGRNLLQFELTGEQPAVLPRRGNRTEKQQLVARCPRCTGEIHERVDL